MSFRGLIIAGTHSGVGKTTITLSLMAAMRKRGLVVQGFKAGPDFIDPGIHRLVTGRPSINLDRWMCGDDYIRGCFTKYSEGADISIVEGVMGLFDGEGGSTAEIAKALGLPVILVMDVSSMAESAAALLKGFEGYDGTLNIRGVILNRIASPKHYRRIERSIAKACRASTLGYLPAKGGYRIQERHLGLLTAEESPISGEALQELLSEVHRNVNVDGVLEIASQPVQIESPHPPSISLLEGSLRIAIARDEAFCFYYEDCIDALRSYGAEVIFFSPMHDTSLPPGIDILYLGGGYPEVYAKGLSENSSMLKSVRRWIEGGGVTYAECGGFMYLTEGVYDFEGNFFPLVGVYPTRARMLSRGLKLGYRQVELREDSPLGQKGDLLRGHEFHYSDIDTLPSDIKRVYRVDGALEGYLYKRTLASYIHIHFMSNTSTISKFLTYANSEGETL